jgi:hypothetical protein
MRTFCSCRSCRNGRLPSPAPEHQKLLEEYFLDVLDDEEEDEHLQWLRDGDDEQRM